MVARVNSIFIINFVVVVVVPVLVLVIVVRHVIKFQMLSTAV